MKLNNDIFAVEQKTYMSLEEALKTMMEAKRLYPEAVVYLNPADENLYNDWSDKQQYIATEFGCINIPIVSLSVDYDTFFHEADDAVKRVADEEAYIAETAVKICEQYSVEGNGGWRLSVMNPQDEYQICLALKPEAVADVKVRVAMYNKQATDCGYSPLTLDEDTMILDGWFKPKPVKKKLFGKSKEKQENETQEASLCALVESLRPYLRRV